MQIQYIVNDIYFKTKTNSTSYAAADMLIHINQAYQDVVAQILAADGRWQWDDNNNTDFPIATATIQSGIQDYAFAVSHLKVLRAQIKYNGATNWTDLEPRDNEDGTLDTVSTGAPTKYDKIGGSFFLEPIPNYTQATSLKVWFQRGPAEFTSGEVSTGTKEPGFASLFHALIPLKVSYNYCVANGLTNLANGYLQDILRLEQSMKSFYGQRDKDDPARLTMAPISFR